MKKLNDYKIKKENEIKETINNFIEQIPKLNDLLNILKDECYGNKIDKYELEKKIEITDEKNLKQKELIEKYSNENNILKEEINEILNGITIGIEVINYLNQMNETVKLIKNYNIIPFLPLFQKHFEKFLNFRIHTSNFSTSQILLSRIF